MPIRSRTILDAISGWPVISARTTNAGQVSAIPAGQVDADPDPHDLRFFMPLDFNANRIHGHVGRRVRSIVCSVCRVRTTSPECCCGHSRVPRLLETELWPAPPQQERRRSPHSP